LYLTAPRKELKEKADTQSKIKNLIVVKAGSKSLLCGMCLVCGRHHMSDNGNWIVTASKLHLCHKPCWDEYLTNKEKYKPSKTPSEAPELTKRTKPRYKYPRNKWKPQWR